MGRPAPVSESEAKRLAALREYDLLDTPPDQTLDNITALAAHICSTPMALVTIVESDRQWFKSRVGFPQIETSREISFCAHAIVQPDRTMIVPDALADPRFARNPLVIGEPRIRFYYGLPLVTEDGYALGTLCVLDHVERSLTADQAAILEILRSHVVAELELRRRAGKLKQMKDELSKLNSTLERQVEARTREMHASLASLQSTAATLRESEERFRSLWETTTDAVLIVTVDNIIRYANPATHQIFGYEPEEVHGKSLAMLQPESLREAHRRAHGKYVETGQKTLNWRGAEVTGLHRDGHEFPIEISFSDVTVGGERLFVGFIRNIAERKQAESKIRRLNRFYAMLSSINTLIVRAPGRGELFWQCCRLVVEHGKFDLAWIGLTNPKTLDVVPIAWAGEDAEQLKDLFGSARGDIPAGHGSVGRAIRERKPIVIDDYLLEPDRGPRLKELKRLGHRSAVSLPLINENNVIGTLSFSMKEVAFFDDEELRLLAELASDISFAIDVIDKDQRLNYLAYYDALTGLSNRTLLLERLTQSIQHFRQAEGRFFLVALNIRRFRNINESLGRHVGDQLLKAVARRLLDAWPGPQNIARVSGDLFAGTMGDVGNAADVAHFLERKLIPTLEAPYEIVETELSIAVVCGVAIYPGDGIEAETLMRNAESALKLAARHGNRYLFYQPSMNAAVSQTLTLESKLRRAVEKEQFVVHYQPKVNLATGHITGLEALIRWNDPDAGLVAPSRFISLLEETGMIIEVGAWAMKRAAEDFAEWRRLGISPPRIAVNVSAMQLAQKDFVSEVERLLRDTDIDLDLEITESMLVEDVEASILKLSALREMGANVVIDDFGAGHSSLVYLGRLPVSVLKIDQSFIARMSTDSQSRHIVSTIVSLAHSLGLKVVAEGVETEAQLAILRDLSCDELQGHIFSPSAPRETIVRMLEKGWSLYGAQSGS